MTAKRLSPRAARGNLRSPMPNSGRRKRRTSIPPLQGAGERNSKRRSASARWSATPCAGFLINGKRTLLRGGCIHHDNGVLGACSYPDAEERRVRILKEQGFNALRISHNPASRALLDACDKLGMYVMDECFDGWYIPKNYHDYSRDFFEGYKDDLRAMVEKDFDHPCVVMYSVGNEVTETASEKGVKLCGEMRDLLHSLDPTRPVTCGINVLLDVYIKKGMGIYRDKGEYRREPLPEGKTYREKRAGSAFFNFWAAKLGGLMFRMSKGKTADKIVDAVMPSLDIIGYNYAASRYDIDVGRHPDKMIVGSETMAGDLPYNWERVKQYPQVIGGLRLGGVGLLGRGVHGLALSFLQRPSAPCRAGHGGHDGRPFGADGVHADGVGDEEDTLSCRPPRQPQRRNACKGRVAVHERHRKLELAGV